MVQSASEIFAGEAKDHKRAIILGEIQGKRISAINYSAAKWRRYETNYFKILFTIWKLISAVGVTPDIVVEESETDFKINSENDNQLKYAINLLVINE